MTVGDLIDELSKYPKDKTVVVKGSLNGTFLEAKVVREGKHKITKDNICIEGGW